MFRRTRAALVAAVAVAAVLCVSTGAALAAKGQFSIGGNFGTGIYSNSDLNDGLEALTPPREKVTSGWEYGGSLRYGVSEKLSLDLEANVIDATSTTDDPEGFGDEEWHVKGLAVPLTINYALARSEGSAFNFFVGAGPLVGAKVEVNDGATSFESDSKTVFMGQGGLEGMYFASPQFAITARALYRIAKIDDLNSDLSGPAFALGLRAFFGGSQ